jgi:MFS family permease
MDRAGGILGPLASYLILSRWEGGFNIIFITAFALGLISVATIFFVTDIVGAKTEDGSKLLTILTIKSLPKAFHYYLVAIFLLSIGSLPIAVLLLKTTSIGLVVASIPLFYMVYSISYSGFSYMSGKLSDEKGSTRILKFGYLALIASYIGIAFADSSWLLVFSFVVLGIFSATTNLLATNSTTTNATTTNAYIQNGKLYIADIDNVKIQNGIATLTAATITDLFVNNILGNYN